VKPVVLYHGSRVLVPVLRPDVNAGARCVALPFALVFLGPSRWSMRGDRLEISQGSLDPNGIGYLYRLATDGFEQINPAVWICREPVTPLDYEVIRSADFAHLLQEDNDS
jgi:hypothetical protein